MRREKTRGRLRIVSFPILLGLAAATARAALMPLPWRIVPGNGGLDLGAGLTVVNSGCPDSAVVRFEARIAGQTGIQLGAGGPQLTLNCGQPAPPWPTLGEDESYTLDVTSDGARLDAPTGTGALRGLETFSQLIVARAGGFEVPAVHIEDRPRFAWRGLMLDVSRHWMPVEVVERNLDAMAAVKLNVFHWHLSDDQGFRVESQLFPQLQQSGSDGDFYTQDQVREVVAYARDRGIRIVPEFDIPGHTTSWFVGMPEIAAAPGPYQIERDWGVFLPVMDAAADPTYAFLDAFLGEMAGLFPDPYFHIGGDEVEDPHALLLQPQFNLRVQALLRQHGKTMVGWDDVLATGLATDAVIQAWHGPAVLAGAAAQGYRGILSAGYYLDYLLPAATHYPVDPGQAPGILGGEACMWAEFVSAETVDSRIWPRMAAIAERFWSSPEVTDVDSMYRRLEPVSRWLEGTGVQHRADYLPMLENLAAGQSVEPLRVLGDASEATGIQVRSVARHYDSLTPLDRFVDAARPESEPVRRLDEAVARLVAGDPSELAAVRSRFREWAANDAHFQPLVSGSAALSELVQLSQWLRTAGEIGLRALQYWEAGKTAPADWVQQQHDVLDSIGQPSAEVVLAAVRPVRRLLDAVAPPASQAR